MDQQNQIIEILQQRFPKKIAIEEYVDMTAVIVEKDDLLEMMRFLRNDHQCSYEQLVDVAGIDYLGYPQEKKRFALVYQVLSIRYNRRLFVKVYLKEPDLAVPSLSGIYKGANWPEREAAEMFGFIFKRHPDPRRLLLCDLFEGKFPLRKDYPLEGTGERESFKIVDRDSA